MSGYNIVLGWLLVAAIAIPASLGAEPSAQSAVKSPTDFERILIVGNGPERHLLEILASEFEQRHPTISVDFFWHPNAKPTRTIELGEADIGITGEEASTELIQGMLGILESGNAVRIQALEPGTRVLLLAALPLNEPVAWGGPFVMNTRDELRRAFDDYQSGRF